MRVVYFHRRPSPGCYSLEWYFESVRRHLPPDISPVVAESRHYSRGLFRRLYNTVEAPFRQGDVNHITGDIHYVSYLMKRQRTILTIPDCGVLHRTSGIRRRALLALWYQLPSLRSAEITVISENVKQDLLTWCAIEPARVHVIPVHIAEHFKFEPLRPSSGPLRILQVGTAQNKNIERLAEALTGLDCHLDCVGRLSETQRNSLVHAGVSFAEHVQLSDEAMYGRYVECDVVSFASTTEGFGMPILEGNAVGRPVVTSNCSSMPEVAGSAACLVDPHRPESIREGIMRVAEDTQYRDALIAAGRLNVLRYRVESIVASYVELYRKVASDGP